MAFPYIAFTAQQDHLIVLPKIVSQTDKMSIWLISLQPGETLLCSKANDLFLWVLSEDCDTEITLTSGDIESHNILAGSYPAAPNNGASNRAVKLKNMSGRVQKFITVEYNK